MTGSNVAILVILALVAGAAIASVITYGVAVVQLEARYDRNASDEASHPAGRHFRPAIANPARYNEQATASAYLNTGPMPIVTVDEQDAPIDLATLMPAIAPVGRNRFAVRLVPAPLVELLSGGQR